MSHVDPTLSDPSVAIITTVPPLQGGGAVANGVTLSVNNVTTTVAGTIPPPGIGTPGSYVYRADGTWGAQAGAGVSSPLVDLTGSAQIVDTCCGSPAFTTSLNRGNISFLPATDRLGLITQLDTSVFSDGRGARHTPNDSVVFSANSGLWSYRCTGFTVPTLSDGTQTFVIRVGFFDVYTTSSVTDGAWLEFDANASTVMRCRTASNGSGTNNASALTPVAATAYDLRIDVSSNATATFYYRASIGQGAWTVLDTISATIPSGTARATQAGVMIAKSAGTTLRGFSWQTQGLSQVPA